ncbi:MAG: NAD-dependent epimerase/dehydratase family protein [Tatlockia sp.]|nr:NAD-dependent epimerase/dehydratase family protein [Tatlockia sp.]
MAILIAGGAGFIGSHLIDYYLNLNQKVIAVDNLSTGRLDNISKHFNHPNFEFHQTDLLTLSDLDCILENCELVYNVAAMVGMFNVLEKPIATLNVNINVTERLLSGISKLKRKPLIIIASSSEVYGSRPRAMKETDSLLIETTSKVHANYPISKLCNEVAGLAYYKEKQVPAIIVRIFNTIGPRQSSRYGMVVPRFINQAVNNQPLTIFAKGTQTRAFCDVRDMCNILHQLSMTDKSVGEIINVGSEKSISILGLADLVKEVVSSKSPLIFKNYNEVYGEGYINIQSRKPNLKKLKSIINYSLEWKLKDTIKDIIKEAYPSAD